MNHALIGLQNCERDVHTTRGERVRAKKKSILRVVFGVFLKICWRILRNTINNSEAHFYRRSNDVVHDLSVCEETKKIYPIYGLHFRKLHFGQHY